MEIVYRAAFMFAFLWIVTRIVGRSTLGELSTFELLLYVTMGDFVQQAVTQQDYSVTSGVLAVGVFALFTVALSFAGCKWPRMRPVVHGIPVVVLRDGMPLAEAMRVSDSRSTSSRRAPARKASSGCPRSTWPCWRSTARSPSSPAAPRTAVAPRRTPSPAEAHGLRCRGARRDSAGRTAPDGTSPAVLDPAVLQVAAGWQLSPYKRRAVLACRQTVPLPPLGRRADAAAVRFGRRPGWRSPSAADRTGPCQGDP